MQSCCLPHLLQLLQLQPPSMRSRLLLLAALGLLRPLLQQQQL
jgi:hypothetical protein